MNILDRLEPARVWGYFEQTCRIPRPSKKEQAISAFLLKFGKDHQLETLQDAAGNILIRKAASIGMEKRKTVILQSHMDMVCEKNADVKHDFDHDSIRPVVKGDWITAEGTTLGADDGIGMAATLAILESSDIPHGPLECLFTVNEESGMSGAHGLKTGWLTGKILINLDSEEDSELFIGCAGGTDTLATFRYKPARVPSGSMACRISVTGLKGGHSGDDIDKGIGNSNKILNRILWNATDLFRIRVHRFDGGNLRNAIPREAFAVITMREQQFGAFAHFFTDLTGKIRDELAVTEPGLSILMEEMSLPDHVLEPGMQRKLIQSIYGCPHGVVAFSRVIPGLVETSTNLASVKFIEDHQIVVTTSQRSSIDSAKTDASDQVASIFKLAGATVVRTGDYPGWKPNRDSEILGITRDSYERLFREKPVVRAIHAGLECGLILEKYPGLDMVSLGPTIKGAHSPDEKISITSTRKFWDLLTDVLKHIP